MTRDHTGVSICHYCHYHHYFNCYVTYNIALVSCYTSNTAKGTEHLDELSLAARVLAQTIKVVLNRCSSIEWNI
jgi:hypothetical protein